MALVGSTNVGKSTLFNRLVRSRDALVGDTPGLTRDRHYARVAWRGRNFIIVDTAGILSSAFCNVDYLSRDQSWLAVDEADVVLFMVDGRCGLTTEDHYIADKLRIRGSSALLVVNKTEGGVGHVMSSDFFSLGMGELFAISASHGEGVATLMDHVVQNLLPPNIDSLSESDSVSPGVAKVPRIAVIGQPNTGKSTFINALLGEDRVVVDKEAGTTRDAVCIDFFDKNYRFQLIDTAGVRRRSKVTDKVETLSVVKTLQAVHSCDVAVLFIDAVRGVATQDSHLSGYLADEGRAVVLVVNKWELLDDYQRKKLKESLKHHMSFFYFAPVCYISALNAKGIWDVIKKAMLAYESANRSFSTSQLTRALLDAVSRHNPPRAGYSRPKLRYAHQGGHNPPVIVIHGNSTKFISDGYKRYLSRFFSKQFCVEGVHLRIEFKGNKNPYVSSIIKE